MTKRNLVTLAILFIITIGIYGIYWFVVTKRELIALGAKDIPNSVLIIIPFANIYYLYKFSEAFNNVVLENKESAISYFLLFLFLLPVGILIAQNKMNQLQDKSQA